MNSQSQWMQFVQLFSEKNPHLSRQQVLQQAKKPFQQLKQYYSQKGGSVDAWNDLIKQIEENTITTVIVDNNNYVDDIEYGTPLDQLLSALKKNTSVENVYFKHIYNITPESLQKILIGISKNDRIQYLAFKDCFRTIEGQGFGGQSIKEVILEFLEKNKRLKGVSFEDNWLALQEKNDLKFQQFFDELLTYQSKWGTEGRNLDL